MIKLFNVKWAVKTAGPSPDNNNRTEVFLLGCQKALKGNPCKGCFNSMTWDANKAEITHHPVVMAENINRYAPNRYVTIGGGEPTDQIDDLITLCRELKTYGFHIMVYSWRSLTLALEGVYGEEFKVKITSLLDYIDMLVDGEFVLEERVYDESKGDGCYNSVGSGNQIVWDIPNRKGYHMRDITSLQLNSFNQLEYTLNKEKVFEMKF